MGKPLLNAPVTIVIPTLENLNYLQGVLKTIEIENRASVIVIDNGSKDGTREWLEKNRGQLNICTFFAHENLGVARSWNIGADLGFNQFESEIVFFLGNDILLKSDTLDLMIQGFNEEKAGMITGKDISALVPEPLRFFSHDAPQTAVFTEAPEFNCFALSKEAFDEVGPFDENFFPAYFEDNDYHYRLKLSGLKALCFNKAEYFHFGSRTMQTSAELRSIINAHFLLNEAYYIKKWGGEAGDEKFVKPFNGAVFPGKEEAAK